MVIIFEHLCCWQQAFLYDHGPHTHTAPQVVRPPFERFRFKVGRHLTISGRWGQRLLFVAVTTQPKQVIKGRVYLGLWF